MKTVKKAILTTTFLLGILIAFLILGIGNMTGYAEATDSGEEYLYLVDGGSDVTVKRGETVSITVQRGDDIIIPILTLGNEDHHIEIEENRLSLLSDSYVGGEIIVFLSYLVEEEIVEIEEPLILLTAFEDDFAIDQAVTPDGYAMTGDFATATVKVNVAGSITDTTLQPQEDIYDILLSSGKDSYGNTEVSVASLDIVGRNGLNNEVVFTANNGENNLNIEPYATNSELVGQGVSWYPYRISSASDFDLIKNYDSSSENIYFEQRCDITITGNSTLNTRTFYGTYDGNDYTLYRDGDISYGGFCMTNEGAIRYLNIEYILSSGSPAHLAGILYAGGVCGYNKGGIDSITINSDSNATVFMQVSTLGFGGIAGNNSNYATISNCTVELSIHKINSSVYDGGIVGYNSANCYNNDSKIFFKYDVVNQQQIGGIAGCNNDTGHIGVFNCQRNLTIQIVAQFDNATRETDEDKYIEAGWLIGRCSDSSYTSSDKYVGCLVSCSGQLINYTYIGGMVGRTI